MRSRLLTLLLGSLLMGGCSGFDLVNAISPNHARQVRRDLVYADHPRNTLDVYSPIDTQARSRAILIFIYGGSWKDGRKENYAFVGHALASRGYTTLIPDYRLYPETRFPGFVDDAANAVRYAVDHRDTLASPEAPIYLMGHSAGAHIAALLLLDPGYLTQQGLETTGPNRAITAAAILSGPYDFDPGPDIRPIFLRDDGTLNPDFQAITFARAQATPPPADPLGPRLLLIHGHDDTVVGAFHSQRLHDALNRRRPDATELAIYPGRGHVQVPLALAWGFRWLCPTLDDIDRFFNANPPH